ncbi:conjugative transposon protein TraJ [Mucilaginibacter paludis]|uniref:Conjugative transposon TraJ protein n=1 Tax=Mucilaginibacter paludis DSM 18603 TaxID=714943 RepID=H1YHW4_9SPHI|nr:conjugative transposon protein TraJ [Mucilaginibacter paludis]EHQ25512.1 conjugative transposon TraJ protein [Mucilaginibacter paludis DSM 18603]
MKKNISKAAILAVLATLLPLFSHAQDTGIADDLHSLQGILENLYTQMMPLCSGMIGVARGIAGFAALWYIGARIWKHIAAAEPVDVYPLLRPFAIGFCIAFFPLVLGLINGILQPVVTATQGMVTNSNQAIARMLEDKPQTATEGQEPSSTNSDPDKWYQYSHPDNSGANATNTNPISDAFSGWSIKNWARKFIAEVLNVLFQAAALCLDTIRTFKLIVLAILGPLCFGLSIFDGFQHTLKQWLARYVNVFMWLPIANIFGAIIAKIQENMIAAAQSGNLPGNEFGNSNTAYLIFLLIGIVGYFTVPSIANYIMNVGGHALFSKTSALASMAMSYASGTITQSFFRGNTQNQSSQQSTNSSNNSGGNTANQGKLSGTPPKS